MEERSYAAIAAYDDSRRPGERPEETRLLILDLDGIGGALCRIDSAGEASVERILPSPGPSTAFGRLAEALGLEPEAAYALWREKRADANRRLEACLKNPGRDYPALQTSGGSLSCAELIGLYEQDRRLTRQLLEEADAALAETGTDPETLRIVLGGRAACFAPAVHTVRAHFCPEEPWLPDDRFADYGAAEDPALLAPRGEELLRERENGPFGHELALVCLANSGADGALREQLLPLAEREQGAKQLSQAAYRGQVYLTARTTLTLSIDGRREALALRDWGIYEGLYRVGFRLAEKKPELCFQRSDDETDVSYIPIKV